MLRNPRCVGQAWSSRALFGSFSLRIRRHDGARRWDIFYDKERGARSNEARRHYLAGTAPTYKRARASQNHSLFPQPRCGVLVRLNGDIRLSINALAFGNGTSSFSSRSEHTAMAALDRPSPAGRNSIDRRKIALLGIGNLHRGKSIDKMLRQSKIARLTALGATATISPASKLLHGVETQNRSCTHGRSGPGLRFDLSHAG